jgi:MOSC domain-containing protein YiiM
MGENLTIEGTVEDEACIGDIWQWGSARLQITAPARAMFQTGNPHR